MRRFTALIMALILIFALCACGRNKENADERECGLYVTMEADDVFTVSCGTDKESLSCQNADGKPIEAGEVLHFDISGEAADSTTPAEVSYTVCLYDEDVNIISSASFTDDLSNNAKIEIVVTADHRILNRSHPMSGDISVSMSTDTSVEAVSAMVPSVEIAARPDAATAINDAIDALNKQYTGEQYNNTKKVYNANIGDGTAEGISAFSMERTIRVLRGDNHLLSLRYVDRASLGTDNSLSIVGHNYDTESGNELFLADICSDTDKLINICSEDILVSISNSTQYSATAFNDGYTDILKGLIADGHWYLSDSGIVIIANPGELADAASGFFEFTVSYDLIKSVIDEKYLPVEYTGDDGDISVQLAKDADEGIVLAGADAAADINSCIVSVSGNISRINVYTVKYNTSNGSYSLVKQLLYYSDLSDGASFAINYNLTDSTPAVLVRFSTPDGTVENRLLSLSAEGQVAVTDPDGGDKGTVITDRMPYTGDLDKNGLDETISVSEEGESVSLVVKSSGETYSAKTGLSALSSVRLYDLDKDGYREIYLEGKGDGDAAVIYAFTFAPDSAEKLVPLSFGEEQFVQGSIGEFADGKLVLKRNVDILGTYSAAFNYSFDGKVFTAEKGSIVFDNMGKFVKTSKEIKLTDGSILAANTSIRFTESDGSSVISFVTDQGFKGSIAIAKADGGWTIGGQPDTSYFVSLPYAG